MAMKPTREQVIQWAKDSGIGWAEGICGMDDFIVAFAGKSFAAGADAEREQCAMVCEEVKSNWNYCAAAIRKRGKQCQ